MAISHTSYVGVTENVDASFPCASATATSFMIYSNSFGPFGVVTAAAVSSGTAPPGLAPFFCTIALQSRAWMTGTPATPGVYTYTVEVTVVESPPSVFVDIVHTVYGVGSLTVTSGGTTVGGPGGSSSGGATVTITGLGFTGVTSVLFGSGASAVAAAGLVVVSDTEIRAVAPPHAFGLVDVQVVGVGTLASAFTFVGVTRASPKAGTVAGGTAVTITGFGFAGATSVLFGGVPATSVVVVSNTTITAVAPPHASGLVDVEVVGVDTGASRYTYTLAVPQILGKGPLLPPLPTRRTA